MGGQGKSQIALEYCHRKKNTQYSAIFWVDATTEESVKGSFQAISEQIRKPADILPDIQARVDLVLRTFSSWSVQWLLVFDNYDNPHAFSNIKTSRQARIWEGFEDFEISLPAYPGMEEIRFLITF